MTAKPHLDRGHARHLLVQMLRIRAFEEKCAELYTQQKIRGFLHLYIGEEANAVGVMEALSPRDSIVATYREHGIPRAVRRAIVHHDHFDGVGVVCLRRHRCQRRADEPFGVEHRNDHAHRRRTRRDHVRPGCSECVRHFSRRSTTGITLPRRLMTPFTKTGVWGTAVMS